MKTSLLRFTTILIIAGLLFAAPGVQTAKAATTLIDTLALTLSNARIIDSDTQQAQSFFVNNTRRLATITLNLYQDGSGTDGTYTVELRNAAGNIPGTLVATIGSGNVADLTFNPEGQVSFTNLNLDVTANRSYFVVVNTNSTGYFLWGYSTDCSANCGGGTFSYYSEKIGAVWSAGVQTTPLRLFATGDQIACTWNAGAGTSAWSTTTNWSCGLAPTNGDAVTIAAASPAPVLTANTSVDTITIQSGASLTVNSGVTLTGLSTLNVNSGGSFTFTGPSANIRVAAVTNNGAITQIQDVPFGSTTLFAIRNSNNTASTYPMLEMTPDSTGMNGVSLAVRGNTNCTTSTSARRCFDITAASPQSSTVRFWYLNTERNAIPVANMGAFHYDNTLGWQALTLAPTPRGTFGLWEWVEAVGVSTFSPFVLSNASPTAISLVSMQAHPAAQIVPWVLLGAAVLLCGAALFLRRKPAI